MRDEEPQHETQRRQFSRILFNAPAQLTIERRRLRCEVLDLSLKGALLRTPTPIAVSPGGRISLELTLGAVDERIRMAGEVSHVEHDHLGMCCREIDLDSVTHLRRLLELNLGSSNLLDREMSALIAD